MRNERGVTRGWKKEKTAIKVISFDPRSVCGRKRPLRMSGGG